MALTLDQQVQIIEREKFQKKITQRLLRKAKTVLQGYNTVTYNSLNEFQKAYVTLARDVIKNLQLYAPTAILMAATEGNLNDLNPADNDINGVINDIFPDMAGIIQFDRSTL